MRRNMKLELEESKQRPCAEQVTTLWLVDDNAEYRRLLAEQFSHMPDFNCARQFGSAEALLEALAVELAPDVILSDVQMPKLSGVDAVAPIKRLAPRTHVVLLTTFYDSKLALKAHQDGASGFLLKRYAFREIVEYLQKTVSGRRSRQIEGMEWPQPPIVEMSCPVESISAGSFRPISTRPSWSAQIFQRLLQAYHAGFPASK